MEKNSPSHNTIRTDAILVWRADNPEDTIGKAMSILGYNNKTLGDIVDRHRNTVSDWRKGKREAPKVVRTLLEDRIKLLNLAQRVRA